ncbi:MAG: DNA polymerase III subunit gamma/tau [Peptococcaceae bacterium]|nr:DNA polymerase III subunit gamma/tau [Peptococcaceae bacterium]
MSYTALYRKFRPGDFRELVGQAHISKTLQHALETGRIVHAYLFCGPRGTGKTSTAKILAQAVNCLHLQNGEPCGECEACKRIKEGQSLDIMEIDAASNRGIDEIRDLRERVRYAPAQEKFKVYIIDEVHMLTNEAFNALLKTLEEPPAHVIFILATTEAHKIPLTVLSRCQRFDFRRISLVDISLRLKEVAEKEHIAITQEAVEAIAKKAEGGLRDAMSLLDQCVSFAPDEVTAETVAMVLGAMDGDFIAGMAAALYQQNLSFILEGIEQLVSQGKDLRQFLQDLLEHFRSLALFQLMPDSQKNAAVDRALQQGALPDNGVILSLMQMLGEVDYRLRNAVQPRIVLELSLLKAAMPQAEAVSAASAAVSAAKAAAPVGPVGPAGPVDAVGAEKPAPLVKQPATPAKEELPPWETAAPAKPGPKTAPKKEPAAKANWVEEDVPWGGADEAPFGAAKQAVKPVAKAAVKAEKPAQSKPSVVPGGAVTLETVKAQWQNILTEVRKQQVTTYAFLREGTVAALADGVLWLSFSDKYKIHMEAMLQPKHKEKVEAILAQLFGTGLTVQCGLEGSIAAVSHQEQADTALPDDWLPPEEPPLTADEGGEAPWGAPKHKEKAIDPGFTSEPEEDDGPDWSQAFDGLEVEEFDD